MAELLTYKRKCCEIDDSQVLPVSYNNNADDHVRSDEVDINTNEDAVIVSKVSYAYITLQNILKRVLKFTGKKEEKLDFPALQNASLSAKKGQIYALLGPSGCGKTTLLRCVLGRLKPNVGAISVFGKVPTPSNAVGYMPQEMALFEEFTVTQTLCYFGHLTLMNSTQLHKRIELLLRLLQLDDNLNNRLVRTLSGGQKRRLSLASALIHNPPLLILDEPTVGVDPILRLEIWHYLRQLCSENEATVIITTHYVEEARSADKVGFMRQAQLLVEESPGAILDHYQCHSLEKVFLQLCNVQDANSTKFKKEDKMISEMNSLKKEPIKAFNVTRCRAIFWKNMFKLTRNPLALTLFCLIPTLSAILYCGFFGQDPKNMVMGIVNEEEPAYLSATFLSMLETSIITPLVVSDLDSARLRVKSGEFLGVITFQHNFSDALQERYLPEVEDDIISASEIRLYMDMSNFVNSILTYQSILRTLERFLANVTATNNLTGVSLPLKFEKYLYGSDHPSFARSQLAGALLAIIILPPILLSQFVSIAEQKDGLLDRSLVMGVRGVEVIVAMTLTQLIWLCLPVVMLLVAVFWFFAMPYDGSMVQIFFLVYLQGVTGASIGLLVAALFDDYMPSAMFVSMIVLPSWLMSGVLWPREGMNRVMKMVSYMWSLTVPTESLFSVICRGWGIEHFEVAKGYIATLFFILLYLVPAVFFFKKFTNS